MNLSGSDIRLSYIPSRLAVQVSIINPIVNNLNFTNTLFANITVLSIGYSDNPQSFDKIKNLFTASMT